MLLGLGAEDEGSRLARQQRRDGRAHVVYALDGDWVEPALGSSGGAVGEQRPRRLWAGTGAPPLPPFHHPSGEGWLPLGPTRKPPWAKGDALGKGAGFWSGVWPHGQLEL